MRGLTERVFDQLTPATRVLVAIASSTPFFVLILLGHGWVIAEPSTRGAVHTEVMLALQGLLVVATLLSIGIGVHVWPLRREPEPVEGTTLLACLTIGVTYTVIAVLAGTFTAPTGLVLLGVLAIGLLLFTLRPMVIAYVVCTVVLVGHDIGVQLGWWSYAPAVTERIFEGRKPLWGYAVWRNTVLLSAAAVLLPLIMLLFGRLDRMHARLMRLSQTDGLTGLANRRRFMEVLQAEVARRHRTGRPLCVVLIDIDHFKRVNDAHGHLAGDAVLRELAALLIASVRAPSDLPARLGGEEFALILPDTPEDEALRVCERLRERVAAQTFQGDGTPLRIGISLGLGAVHDDDVASILSDADRALYCAKAAGRNRVCLASCCERGTA
ncbi:diguanylate cyclase (GGDEF)-like protein [Aquabacterium commune]|uniref:diguanylate cyclase n=1 Tax=Aquabacterium commune TaxID=70586 RepID=A0A4R6RA24_9BURK|nr:GGDEF domain-containing protein [Aquabacterium commune]TDP82842.1 diguanylate cyclase (GGDEF)-like protein [Aquabacterium commune]